MSPSVSDLSTHLGYWLRYVSNHVSQAFAERVAAKGVTVAEWVFLRMLYDVESIAPSQLAERMGMTKGAISKLADRLVEKNLVSRDAKPDGKRGQTLMLKPAARELVPRLAELADRNDAMFFGGLSPEERGELERLLRLIARERGLSDIPVS
jgi:DNA-binding MarR family transcriptional regulator